jgi:membrane protease YdiL (CAAX protease family)
MKLSISTTRRQTLLGWAYWLISLFVLPSAFETINNQLATPLPESVLNLIFFSVNFLAVVCIFHGFLWESLKAAAEKMWKCLGIAALGIAVHYAALWLITQCNMAIKPGFSNVNDNSILNMLDERTPLLAFATVFFVPVAEETLYRGLLFQTMQRQNRLMAYIMSVALFSSIHVMGYVGVYDPLTLTLCFVQYLPVGVILALAYEQTDTVITPILIHTFINLIGLFITR